MAIRVEFKTSGKVVDWNDRYDSILELARANGVEIDSDCEAGICGTCKIRLLSGKVDMEVEDGLEDDDIEQNMILACVAVPLDDIVLEA
jgi:glycine betaine catabolism B